MRTRSKEATMKAVRRLGGKSSRLHYLRSEDTINEHSSRTLQKVKNSEHMEVLSSAEVDHVKLSNHYYLTKTL